MSGLDKRVTLGEISGVWGVRGWVRLRSFTDPPTNILAFSDWLLERPAGSIAVRLEAAEPRGRGFVAKLVGVDSRDEAAHLLGAKVVVPRASLPPCAPGEYYWADLEGLVVETRAGTESRSLGRVRSLIPTGAHDVLVVTGERERLIPFVPGRTVRDVDLERGVITVDWDPDF